MVYPSSIACCYVCRDPFPSFFNRSTCRRAKRQSVRSTVRVLALCCTADSNRQCWVLFRLIHLQLWQTGGPLRSQWHCLHSSWAHSRPWRSRPTCAIITNIRPTTSSSMQHVARSLHQHRTPLLPGGEIRRQTDISPTKTESQEEMFAVASV